jgi:large subunit ribosomal protein L10
MSKKVKNLIEREIGNRLKDVEGCAVISPRGIDGIKNNNLRRKLREQGARMFVLKNTLARRATAKGKIAGFEKLLDGPSAIIYGNASIPAIARLLVEEKKTNDKLELKGVFFDGEAYIGEAGVKTASKLPTREEAVAQLVGAILGPGRKLAAALKGPGGKLGGILKTIEEKGK